MSRGNHTLIETVGALLAVAGLALGCGHDVGLPSGDSEAELPPVFDHSSEVQAPERVLVVGEGHAAEISRWSAPSNIALPPSPTVRAAGAPSLPGGEVDGIAMPAPKPVPAPMWARYGDGELCTWGADVWGAPCGDDSFGACVWTESFEGLAPLGIVVGQGHKRLTLQSADAIIDALPGELPADKLGLDLSDPYGTQVNRLASELTALELNVLYNRAGKLGTRELGRAVLNYGPFAGWTLYGVQRFAEEALSGDTARVAAMGLDMDILADEVAALNSSAAGCRASDWIRPPAE